MRFTESNTADCFITGYILKDSTGLLPYTTLAAPIFAGAATRGFSIAIPTDTLTWSSPFTF